MKIDRRLFLISSLSLLLKSNKLEAKEKIDFARDQYACLIDTTLCIGCRKCEEACNKANKLLKPQISFEDKIVFKKHRRPDENSFTVVNEFLGSPSISQRDKSSTTVKIQCMHCLDPSCVSACIVGALKKREDGPVVYNPKICIGCRYCMIACPFEVIAYEYSNPLTPRVRKCQFCTNTNPEGKADPACAAACPTEAIVFGKRGELLEIARNKIKQKPAQYINHIYGEYEIGGTSWIYLSGRDFEEIGFKNLPNEAPPRLTESIQHSIFKYGAIPIAFYLFLGAIMLYKNRKEKKGD